MSNKVLLPKDVDTRNLVYSLPKAQDMGAKFIRVTYKGEPLVIQTPTLYVPFGISCWPNEQQATAQNQVKKFSLDLALRDMEGIPAVRELHDMLARIDEQIVDDAWSGKLQIGINTKKLISRDVIAAMQNSSIKMPREEDVGRYPPNIKIGLPVDENGAWRFPTFVTVDNKLVMDGGSSAPKQFDPMEIDRTFNPGANLKAPLQGSMVTAIIQCTGVWVAGGSAFGCSWKVVQLRVRPAMSQRGYAFRDDDAASLLLSAAGISGGPTSVPDLTAENEEVDEEDAAGASGGGRKRAAAVEDDDEDENEDEGSDEEENNDDGSRAQNKRTPKKARK